MAVKYDQQYCNKFWQFSIFWYKLLELDYLYNLVSRQKPDFSIHFGNQQWKQSKYLEMEEEWLL